MELSFDAGLENISVGNDYPCKAEPECGAVALKFWVSAKSLGDFTMSINMNTFGENLKEELCSTASVPGS